MRKTYCGMIYVSHNIPRRSLITRFWGRFPGLHGGERDVHKQRPEAVRHGDGATAFRFGPCAGG